MRMAVAAFCAAVNFSGAYIALCLKLPVCLDSIGTLLAAALLGPWYGMAAAMGSAFLSGVTSDIYALYFMPAGMITGITAGLLFKTRLFKGRRTAVGTALLTLPGSLVGAVISAFVFGGVTSSGSSILVQLFCRLGCGLVASAFAVQIITDYADRFISAALVLSFLSYLTEEMKMRLRGGHD
ncbi:ECF transporter S component [Clostridium sp. AM58-1XD]|nr:ECF transporter S component [Clostridium sp. AM58-1XD]